jgi:hypothetical protein
VELKHGKLVNCENVLKNWINEENCKKMDKFRECFGKLGENLANSINLKSILIIAKIGKNWPK